MLSKGQPWKPYENRRKRSVRLNIRCTETEREQVYKLAESKEMTLIELLNYLVEKELKEE